MRTKIVYVAPLFAYSVLFVLASYMAWNLFSEHKRLKRVEVERLVAQTMVIGSGLNSHLDAVNNAIISIGAGSESGAKAAVNASEYISILSGIIPSVKTFFILDVNGWVTKSNKHDLVGMDLHERKYFNVALQENNPSILHVSPPIKNALGTFSINLEHSRADSLGRFSGLVGATLNPEYFTTLLDSMRYADDVIVTLSHADGEVFLTVPQLIQGQPSWGEVPISHFNGDGDAVIFERGDAATGGARLFAQRALRPGSVVLDYPLIVTISRDEAAIFEQWNRSAVLQVGLLLLLVVVVGVGGGQHQKHQQRMALLEEAHDAERQRNEERLRLFFDRQLVGMGILSSKMEWVQVNDKLCRMLGYTHEEMLGRTWIDVTPPDEVAQELALIKQFLTGNFNECAQEKKCLRKDGSILCVALSLGCVRAPNGDIEYYLAILSDVTEHKTQELHLMEANARLEQFALLVSHDLRQPLGVLRSYVGIIKNECNDHNSGCIESTLRNALINIDYMDRLINGALEYSRSCNVMDMSRLCLGDPINMALRDLNEKIFEYDVDVNVQDEMPEIIGSMTELVRLFENIIGNAINYRSSSRLLKIDIGYDKKDDHYLVWVKDNGIGIAPELREKAFAMFRRLSPQTGEGVGVGLPICRKIVEEHNGKIWVASEDAVGCVFHMTFPIPPTEDPMGLSRHVAYGVGNEN